MLGKLMKYEWKATWKLLLPLNALIIVMALLAGMTVRVDFFKSDNSFVFLTGVAIIVIYVMSMLAVVVGTAIFLIYRFYTSVYGKQGYLLHTLPLDKHHIIISKALASALWLMLSDTLIILSVFFLFSSKEGFFEILWEVLEEYIKWLDLGAVEGGFTVVMTVIASVFSVFARVLKVTACISLGQLSSNHKALTAFAFYYALYFCERIFMVLRLAAMDAASSLFDGPDLGWEGALIGGIISCVAFYLITWYVMEKKLNLE